MQTHIPMRNKFSKLNTIFPWRIFGFSLIVYNLKIYFPRLMRVVLFFPTHFMRWLFIVYTHMHVLLFMFHLKFLLSPGWFNYLGGRGRHVKYYHGSQRRSKRHTQRSVTPASHSYYTFFLSCPIHSLWVTNLIISGLSFLHFFSMKEQINLYFL